MSSGANFSAPPVSMPDFIIPPRLWPICEPACISVSGTLPSEPKAPPTSPPAAPSTADIICGSIEASCPAFSILVWAMETIDSDE